MKERLINEYIKTLNRYVLYQCYSDFNETLYRDLFCELAGMRILLKAINIETSRIFLHTMDNTICIDNKTYHYDYSREEYIKEGMV